MKGIIVYSFAWRKVGHSRCNVRLAEAAKRIAQAQHEPVLIIAQRSTAKVLQELGIPCEIVQKRTGYEGSEEVTLQAADLFRRHNITAVIPVAQPFLQLTKCIQLVRRQGFTTPSLRTLLPMIGWIGFDQLSVQPATRGVYHLVFYTARQVLFGYRPPVEQSEP